MKRNKATTINRRLYGKMVAHYRNYWFIYGGVIRLFLKSLTYVTDVRLANPWLLFILPISGVVFTYFYTRFGKNASRGNNLVIEQGNGGEEDIPLRLIPLTLFGTITTHLFGGSVGREGTAVQMGAQSQML